jgi:hypothetical protein
MNNKQRRQHIQQRNRKQKLVSGIIWSGIGVAVLAILGVMVWQGIRPAAGEAVPIIKSDPHLATDSDPGQYIPHADMTHHQSALANICPRVDMLGFIHNQPKSNTSLRNRTRKVCLTASVTS